MKDIKSFVIITPGFPATESETTCLPFLQHMVKALYKEASTFKIIVIATDYPFKKGWYTWNGIEVFAGGASNKKGFQRLISWAGIFIELNKINKQHKIEAILSVWLTQATFTAVLSNLFINSKHLALACGQDMAKENRYFKWLSPKRFHTIALSDFIADELKKKKLKVDAVIPSGMDISIYKPATLKRDLTIYATGSLIKLKRYDLFIQLIHELKNHLPDNSVMLSGEGPEKQTMQNLIDQYELNEKITLTGNIPYHEVLCNMNRTKVFLHTSEYEGQSAVIKEALYCGAHVVCFDVGIYYQDPQLHICKTTDQMRTKLLELVTSEILNIPSQNIQTTQKTARDILSFIESKAYLPHPFAKRIRT